MKNIILKLKNINFFLTNFINIKLLFLYLLLIGYILSLLIYIISSCTWLDATVIINDDIIKSWDAYEYILEENIEYEYRKTKKNEDSLFNFLDLFKNKDMSYNLKKKKYSTWFSKF